MMYLKTIAVLLLVAISLGASAEMPEVTRLYSPGPSAYPFHGHSTLEPSPIPTTGVWTVVSDGLTEPGYGYPFHNSMYTGINDTHMVRIVISNSSSTTYSIGSANPNTWLIPVLYLNADDFVAGIGGIDTSHFEYVFRRWAKNTGSVATISKPANIAPAWSYILEYDVWDLPKGIAGVDFIKSALAPSDISVLKGRPGSYCYLDPQNAKDSINAYTAICIRMRDRGNLSAAKSWTDSMRSIEDSSIVAWNWRGIVTMELADTINAIDAFGRVISIIQNNSDPLIDLADSTLSLDERYWASDRMTQSAYWKWKLENKYPLSTN